MITAKTGVKNTEVSARIIRADGTIEELGVIASMKQKTLVQKLLEIIKGDK